MVIGEWGLPLKEIARGGGASLQRREKLFGGYKTNNRCTFVVRLPGIELVLVIFN